MDVANDKTEKLLTKTENRIKKEYKQAEKELEAKMKSYLQGYQKDFKVMQARWLHGEITGKELQQWRMNHIAIGKRWEAMKESMSQTLVNSHRVAEDLIKNHSMEVYALNYNYGTFLAEKSARINTSFTLYDKHAVARLMVDNPKLLPNPSANVSRKIKEQNLKKWSKRKMQSVMTQAVLQGESMPKIAKRLSSTVGDMTRKQAIRNAQTMTTSVMGGGRLDAFKRAEGLGIQMEKEWVSTPDARTRPSHRAMNGEKVPVNEEFSNGLMFPADPDGKDGREIYNCRCTMIGAMAGLDENGQSLAQTSSYDEDLDDFETWLADLDKKAKASGGGGLKKTSNGTLYIDVPDVKPKAPKPKKTKTVAQKTAVHDSAITNAIEYSAEYHTKHNYERLVTLLGEKEKRGIVAYTGSAYREMNDYLRGVIPDIARRERGLIDAATTGLEKTKIAEDTLLYRGMGSRNSLARALGVDRATVNEILENELDSLVGQTFIEKGFCSAGINSRAGWSKTINLEIIAPKGTKGMYVDPISRHMGEEELLLQRGTQFRIVSAKRNGDNFVLRVLVVDQKAL